MNDITPTPQDFLQQTLILKRSLERDFLELGARLKRIRDERLYEGTYDSFREFLDDAKLTESFASRLITIHSRFIEQFHMKQDELSDIGWSSLYQIASYTEDEEEAIELVGLAKRVRRVDLEDEIRERKTKCSEHEFGEERIVLKKCIHCGKTVRVYEEDKP